jgi:hypothetical protein
VSGANHIGLGYLSNAPRAPPSPQRLNKARFPTLLQIERHCFLEHGHPFLAPDLSIKYFGLALGEDGFGVASTLRARAFAVAETANGACYVPDLDSLRKLQHERCS